jgi:hypothetical protein
VNAEPVIEIAPKAVIGGRSQPQGNFDARARKK